MILRNWFSSYTLKDRLYQNALYSGYLVFTYYPMLMLRNVTMETVLRFALHYSIRIIKKMWTNYGIHKYTQVKSSRSILVLVSGRYY